MNINSTKMKQAIIALSAIIMASGIVACQVDYSKTPSGMVYKITRGKSDSLLRVGQIIKYSMTYSISPKDSVLNSTGNVPQYIKVDTGIRAAYTFMELLPKTHVGDSLEFVLEIDTLKKPQNDSRL